MAATWKPPGNLFLEMLIDIFKKIAQKNKQRSYQRTFEIDLYIKNLVFCFRNAAAAVIYRNVW